MIRQFVRCLADNLRTLRNPIQSHPLKNHLQLGSQDVSPADPHLPSHRHIETPYLRMVLVPWGPHWWSHGPGRRQSGYVYQEKV